MLIPATYRYLTTLQKGLVIAVVLLGAIGLGSGARPSSVDRILTLGEEVGSAVASQGEDNLRIRIWRRGLEQWAQRTILGVGLGSYKSSIASESRGHSVAPHSSFVAILVEQGAIGFLLFLLMMANLVQVAWRSRAVERTLFLLLLLSWSAGVMFMQQDYKKHTWVVFALVAAASSRRPVPSEPGLPVAYSELPEAKWAG
jgi:O-antigen ligase